MVLAGLGHRARARWWTTPSSTSRTSSGGCGRTARRASRQPAFRVVLERLARGAQRGGLRQPDRRRWCSCRSSSSTGLAGSFFRPLALAYVLAIAGVAAGGADGHAGAVADAPARRAAVERESPLVARAARRGYRAMLAARHRTPRPAFAMVAGRRSSWPRSCSRRWARSSCPTSRRHDFLMHWVEKPGTSLEAMPRITTQASQRAAGDPRRAQLRLAHRPRRGRPTRSSAPNFTELWISVDPKADYDATRGQRSRRWSTATRACTATC